ncbi:hypothetical protein V6N12_057506 [Hibiscus sabdariffa]|uniref:Uncharacterized protein n=1 Tax=Hibiscus sabdariffa TaxID=183260 RepID=A0ABR2C5P1_9ROSI
MQGLKVLEFNRINLTSLPSSIGCLKTLCTLRLRNCDLEDIAIIGELGNLEILDLRRSRMKMLPKKIGQLTRLKLLDLSDCDKLQVITPNVLSKLSKLEELYLYDSFDKWEVEGIENPRSNSSLVELQRLSRLTTLEVHIPDVEAIPKDNLFFGKMERYKISIGDEKYNDRGMGTSRMLKLKVNKSIHSVDGIKHLLGETQSLHLDGMEDVGEMQMLYHPNVESFGQLRYMKVKNCNMMKNLFSFSIVKRLCQLEELEISDCENITNLIVEKEEVDENDILEFNKLRILKLNKLNRFSGSWCSAITFQSSTCLFDKKVNFPVLEKLEIRGMDNLERLWADQLVEHSFSKLTSISLWKCPKLLNVFPGNMLTRLQRLERLIIKRCKSVEEIIYEGGNSSSGGMPSLSPQIIQSDVEFPNLTSLTLRKLPNLKSIHHNKMHTINWPSLKQMEVKECHRVGIVFAKSGETSSEQPLFWVNQSTFPNLHKLTLGWHCNNSQQQQQLLSLYFPHLKLVKLWGYPKEVTVLPSYLLSLPNLQKLEISDSCFKEMIFQSEEGGEEKPASLLLSQITKLRLDSLKELMHLWKEKEGFPNLRILHVSRCRELKVYLIPSSVSFENLVTLEVKKCNGIIKLITHSTAKSLVHLKKMSIWQCQNIEEIIQGGDDDDDDEISFPQLNSLKLEDLPKLESFCSSDKYSFGFPSLQFLLLHKCPKMKMFSQRHSNTPLLHKVQLDKHGFLERWEGSLDITIQKLFRRENSHYTNGGQIIPLVQNLKKEVQNSVKDQDIYSTSKEDQSKPSTSST